MGGLLERACEAAKDHLEIDYDGGAPFIRLDSIEAAVRAVTATLAEPAGEAEPVAWRRKWNFQGRPCEDEFTDSAALAEQWRTHPQTNEVIALYPTPPDASAIRGALPATGPYVDRLIRVFRDRPDDDGSAVVLQDYARAAIAWSAE